jgi:hypothetical protein
MAVPIDEELAEVVQRRTDAVDRLITALIDVDTCTRRMDVLLDRRMSGDPLGEDLDDGSGR